jgi:hypothetical protein
MADKSAGVHGKDAGATSLDAKLEKLQQRLSVKTDLATRSPSPNKPLPAIPTGAGASIKKYGYTSLLLDQGTTPRHPIARRKGLVRSSTMMAEPKVEDEDRMSKKLPGVPRASDASSKTMGAPVPSGSLFNRRRRADSTEIDAKSKSIEVAKTVKPRRSLNFSRPVPAEAQVLKPDYSAEVKPLTIVKKHTSTSSIPPIPKLTEAEHIEMATKIFKRELAKDEALQNAFRESWKILDKSTPGSKSPDEVSSDGFADVEIGALAAMHLGSSGEGNSISDKTVRTFNPIEEVRDEDPDVCRLTSYLLFDLKLIEYSKLLSRPPPILGETLRPIPAPREQ